MVQTTERLSLTGIFAAVPSQRAAAEALARQLALPLHATLPSTGLVLQLDEQGLALRDTRPGAPGAVRADFSQLARRRAGSLRSEAVARAVGLRGNQPLTVIDATAGLGRDAFVLACLGAQVHLIERSPAVAALLRDALERAGQDPALAAAAARMRLHHGDALELLPRLAVDSGAQAIYLDPMYPEDGTKGQVKKDMQLLRSLLGPQDDVEPLLGLALNCPVRRVVVKRPRRAAPLAGHRPSHSIAGRSTRFDVYVLPQR